MSHLLKLASEHSLDGCMKSHHLGVTAKTIPLLIFLTILIEVAFRIVFLSIINIILLLHPVYLLLVLIFAILLHGNYWWKECLVDSRSGTMPIV